MFHKIFFLIFLLYGCTERISINFGNHEFSKSEIKKSSVNISKDKNINIAPKNLSNAKKQNKEKKLNKKNDNKNTSVTRQESIDELTKPIFFEYDKYDVSKEQKSQIIKLSNFLLQEKNKRLNIRIEGHCDDRGTREYNFALGYKRAFAIQEILNKNGLGKNRITVISYGKERPAYLGKLESSRAQNRRADLLLRPNVVIK